MHYWQSPEHEQSNVHFKAAFTHLHCTSSITPFLASTFNKF